jgi:hypothetical protein
MRPCSSRCWYCRCCSARSLDGAIRTLIPGCGLVCVVQVRNATLHPRQMLPSKAASMRRAALPVAARGRPRLRTGTSSLPPVVRRMSSVATAGRPLQPPQVVRLASDRVALSRRPASITSQARDDLCWNIRFLPTKSVFGTIISGQHLHRPGLQPPPVVCRLLATAARCLLQTLVGAAGSSGTVAAYILCSMHQLV